ncbi:MAG: hypothetical protein ACE366_01650 [Bradymonadia bacterium]
MSTFVVVRKGDQVCIAADTLSIFEGTEEFAGFISQSDKIIRVGKSWIGFDGSVAVRLAAQHHFSHKGSKRHLYDPLSIFETLGDLAEALRAQGLTLPACLIISPRGIFRAGADRSVVELNRFEALGSGRRYALGAMHAVYDALPSAEAVAMAGLEAASRFDPASELPMTRYTLRVGGQERDRDREEPRKSKRGKRRRDADEVESVAQKAAENYRPEGKGYTGKKEENAKVEPVAETLVEAPAEAKTPAEGKAKADVEAIKSAPYFTQGADGLEKAAKTHVAAEASAETPEKPSIEADT